MQPCHGCDTGANPVRPAICKYSMAFTAFELAEKLAQGRESAEKGIARYCPIPVFITDAQGRWTSVNEPMQRLMAQSEGQLTGDRWLLRVQPLVLDEVEAGYAKIFESKPASAKLFVQFTAADKRAFSAYITFCRSGSTYVCFLVPVCTTPVDCPVHGFLLHNVEQQNGL